MIHRVSAACLLSVCILATLAGLVIGGFSEAPVDPNLGPVLAALLPLGLLSFPIVGALVVSRRCENPVGWLLLAFGVLHSLGIAADSYYRYRPGPLPGASYAAWFMHWSIQSPAIFTFFVFFLLLFPDGSLPSPRWRKLAWLSGGATTGFVALWALKPGPMAETHPPLENPVAVEAVGAIWRALELPLVLAVMLSVPAAAVAFVLRFRRARGVERQQLKWFALAGVVIGLVVATAPIFWSVEALWWAWPILFLVGTTSIPIAAGIAILRYRLYDIDRIISRTLSYALLTAVLVGGYGGLVFTLTLLLRPLTGTSDLAVAASTLAMAALFRPVRSKIQSAVDRRFNRARYEAAHTLEEFAARLRDEIDLDELGQDLTGVVRRTMQPAHVSLWLPEATSTPTENPS